MSSSRPLVAATLFLILSILRASSAVDTSHHHHHHVHQAVFETYDFDNDTSLNQDEFNAVFLSTFKTDEQRYLKPKTLHKLFDYLDIDGDGRLQAEEFRKAFQRWLLPLIAPKSCLFLCSPRDANNSDELENEATKLIEQSQDLFKVHYVFLSACNDNGSEPTSQLVEHVQKLLPKAHDITVYNVASHLHSLKHRDFDQFIVYLSNIKHDRSALKDILEHNSARQHPTVIVAEESDRQLLGDYLDQGHLNSSILVRPTMDARERANYKVNLALILARKIYRQYFKKLIH